MNIFPSQNEKLITTSIISFFVGAIIGLFVGNNITDNNILITAITTLAAAFVGAFSAFKLQELHKRRERENKQRSAANRAIYNIWKMWSELLDYANFIIQPALKTKNPGLSLRTTSDANFDYMNNPKEDLLFIVDSDLLDVNLYVSFHLEEQRYNKVVSLVRDRNKMVSEIMLAHGKRLEYFPDGSIITESFYENVSAQELKKLNSISDAIIRFVQDDINSLIILYKKFQPEMEKYFKNKKVLDLYEIKSSENRSKKSGSGL